MGCSWVENGARKEGSGGGVVGDPRHKLFRPSSSWPIHMYVHTYIDMYIYVVVCFHGFAFIFFQVYAGFFDARL